jgi:DNA mismatch repair protein MutS
MQIDKTTYDDLSIFSREEEFSIFQKVNFTRTRIGKDWLLEFFNKPFSDLKRIKETQKILTLILSNEKDWPSSVSNGTIMVMEKFYETAIDDIPANYSFLNAFMYKILHGPDYSIVRYSIQHFGDFVRGMNSLINLFDNAECPELLKTLLDRARFLLSHETIQSLNAKKSNSKLSFSQQVYYGYYLRNRFKNFAFELINIYGRFDAWYSMAKANQELALSMPVLLDQPQPVLAAKSLFHMLLPAPVPYDVHMDRQTNFIFLTGANMGGKSTFIKAVGISVYLAHLGMGVPATSMELSLFDGILSNINVVDNIAKGESYFFNEVQRIKNTIIKINDSRKWLVLIDELFKGTNVEDSMKCSSTVIKGLIKINSSLFILSTHLYEIGEELKQYPNIGFKYFETTVKEDQLEFSYQLKDGISNDRLGYLIMKREKVVEMLENL